MTTLINDSLRRLAATLKALPNEQDRDPPPGLNLPGHTYQQKLVSPEIIEAHLSITYQDHLKGQVVVDYFTHVLAGERKVLDNLLFIVEEARKKNAKPMLSLPLILVECGVRLRELAADHLRSPDVRRRFDARNARPDATKVAQAADPYYLAVAALVAEQVAPSHRELLSRAGARQDLKAILFADAALALGESAEARQALAASDFPGASIAAAEALKLLATPDLLHKQLELLLAGQAP
jgi:hypothetical protein